MLYTVVVTCSLLLSAIFAIQRSLARAAALSPQLCCVCGRALPCRPRAAWGLTTLLPKREQGTRRDAQKLSQQARRYPLSSVLCIFDHMNAEHSCFTSRRLLRGSGLRLRRESPTKTTLSL